MSFLKIDRADKGYGPAWNRAEVLSDINLEVERGMALRGELIGFLEFRAHRHTMPTDSSPSAIATEAAPDPADAATV